MNDERHERIAELFARAGRIPAEERARFLASACGADEALRAELEALLEHTNDGAVDAARRAVAGAARELTASSAGDVLPESIGGFRILARLGHGGMGVVYEAEQSRPRRRVALKVVRPGLATPGLLRRFEQEAEVLGLLDHPGIASIHAAGMADEGAGPQPWFAMELVRGEPLRRHAASHRLDARARLELIARIAEAVQHAHERGVVHRDLKPANVLVDEEGRPKVLDFGVARATDADLGSTTALTRTGELVGTLAYMSPEQLGGDPARVDARSDVYALGVVAYELLSGRLPHTVADVSLPEAARRITEDEPPPLGAFDRRFQGEVETIVGKALEKEPERRYASMAELAADVNHYLADEPISARPPSTIYKLRKFARRNRLLVGGTATLFVVLSGGIVGTSLYALRAERARADASHSATLAEERRIEAQQQATRATSVNDFLNDDLLAAADPSGYSDPDLTVREVLDRAHEELATGRFADQPLVRASVLETIGRSYVSLSRFEPGEESLAEAARLYEQELGPHDASTLRARLAWADAQRHRERFREVEPIYEELRGSLVDVLGEGDPTTLACLDGLAQTEDFLGKYDEAADLLESVLRRTGRDPEGVDDFALGVMRDLALVHVHRSELDEGRKLYEDVVAGTERLHGPDHILTAQARAALAGALYQAGRYQEAIDLYVPALAIMKRVLGDHHETYLVHAGNLGICYNSLNRFDESEPILEQVYEASVDLYGEKSKETLLALLNLSAVYVGSGRYAEAVPLLEKAHEGQSELLGEGHDDTLLTLNGLAIAYSHVGRPEDAERAFREVLDLRHANFGPDNAATIAAASALGFFLTQQGRMEEAAPLHAEAVEAALRTMPDHVYTGVFLSRQAIDFQKARRYPEAADAAEKAYSILEKALGAGHRRTRDVAQLLGDVHAALGDADGAEEWHARAEAPDAPAR